MSYAVHELDRGFHGEVSDEIRRSLADLTDDERRAVCLLVDRAVVVALGDLLYAVVEASEDEGLAVQFDGHDLEPLSDGLHGDLFSWLADFGALPYDTDTFRLRLADVPSFPHLVAQLG